MTGRGFKRPRPTARPAGGPGATIELALRSAGAAGCPALAAFLTAGWPRPASFRRDLEATAREADVVEVGVPFSDPMADGVTIQRSSRGAIAAGVTLAWILDELAATAPEAPLVLMSYLNPLLAYGLERLAERAETCRVAGLIVPDLPLEESGVARSVLEPAGVGLVQLVTPVTPPERMRRLCAASRGFVYAVTRTGTTGTAASDLGAVSRWLAVVRDASPVPVMAGFGIRSAAHVRAVAPPADGVIVGSALVECLERGENPRGILRTLRGEAA